ncbi:MAG: ATP-binding protein, partial [Sulfolobales archaeon]
MKRVKLRFAGELEIMFADRDLALKRIREWGERGTRFPQVVFGPEGCGKSSWLRQSIEALKEMNYDIIYINPIEKILATEIEIASIREYLMNRIIEIIKEDKWGLLVNIVIDLVRETIKLGRGKIAILVDEAFHVIGYEKSALYVKALLGVIEYPPASYEKIIAVVATSEGLSRREIG